MVKKILYILSFALVVTGFGPFVMADEQDKTDYIKIENAYGFATMPGAKTGAAFMTITNTGQEADALIEAKSDIAEHTEIHENYIDPDDGTMMMRKIKKVDVPAGGQATLGPKGAHVMLIKLKEPLTMEQNVPLTLVFEKAGKMETSATIIAPGSPAPGSGPNEPETQPHQPHHDH